MAVKPRDRWLYLAQRFVRHFIRNAIDVWRGTRPGSIFFEEDIISHLGCSRSWLHQTAREYRWTPAAWRKLMVLKSSSWRLDGYAFSLDTAEGFAAWALIKHTRPQIVVEIGTQHGVSARLWKEALNKYVPGHQLILIDLVDQRRHITDREARFIKGDGRAEFRRLVETVKVDMLFNDAHPYDLIRDTVSAGLRHGVRIFAFHDVGRGPLSRFRLSSAGVAEADRLIDDGPDYLTYGTWERHVMAETFGKELLVSDRLENETHRVQIYDSTFGLGAAILNVKGRIEGGS